MVEITEDRHHKLNDTSLLNLSSSKNENQRIVIEENNEISESPSAPLV